MTSRQDALTEAMASAGSRGISATSLRHVRSGARQAYRRLAWWIALSDLASVFAAYGLATLTTGTRGPELSDYVEAAVLGPVFAVMVYRWFDLYAIYRLTPPEEFRRLVFATGVSFALVVLVAFLSKQLVPRSWLVWAFVLATFLVLVSRRAWHFRIGRLRHEGKLRFRTLIVGTNEEARHLAEVTGTKRHGFQAIGFVTTGAEAQAGSVDGLPIVGTARNIRDAIAAQQADCVFVASSAIEAEDLRHLARACRLGRVELRVSANLPEILSTRLSIQPVGGVMSLSVHPPELTGYQAALKRSIDLGLSAAALVVLSPVFLLISLAVKLTSQGPVFYRQERLGRNGGRFTMLKFRTMVRGADRMLVQLQQSNESSGPLFKMKDDPRLTRVGRFLRRWSLDELPQFVNVFTGRMSLVGPRPPLAAEVADYQDWHFDRLLVRPGLTGLWQVSGRSTLSFDDYVRLDLFYIENWSLSYDLFILAKTVPAVLTGRGSY